MPFIVVTLDDCAGFLFSTFEFIVVPPVPQFGHFFILTTSNFFIFIAFSWINNKTDVIYSYMILIRYFKGKKKVNEDDATPDAEAAQKQAVEAKIQTLNNDVTKLEQDIVNIESASNAAITDKKNQIVKKQEEIAKLGGEVTPSSVIEGRKCFGRKLYEASANRTDEMYTAISMAFDSIDGLSYTPNTTKRRTMARKLVEFINRNESWSSDGEDHTDAFNDEVRRQINAGQMSLSQREKDKFVAALDEQLTDNLMFSWIFKENNKQ